MLVDATLRLFLVFFFFSSRRRHTRYWRDWSSDVCSSDLPAHRPGAQRRESLGAWAMSWGKLLGGTSFVWYAGLIALAVALRFGTAWPSPDRLAFAAATAIASGLLGQTVALAAILAFRRKMPAERRLPVLFSQLLG